MSIVRVGLLPSADLNDRIGGRGINASCDSLADGHWSSAMPRRARSWMIARISEQSNGLSPMDFPSRIRTSRFAGGRISPCISPAVRIARTHLGSVGLLIGVGLAVGGLTSGAPAPTSRSLLAGGWIAFVVTGRLLARRETLRTGLCTGGADGCADCSGREVWLWSLGMASSNPVTLTQKTPAPRAMQQFV